MKTFIRRQLITSAVIFALYSASVAVAGLSAKPQASDVAVVLGNEVLKNGEAATRLKMRLNAAIDLYKRDLTGVIVVSGGPVKTGGNEAIVMAQYLRDNGIPEKHIIMDELGVNTRATANNTAKLMQEKDWHSVTIVSQYFHLPRCLLAFHEAGIPTRSAAYPVYFELLDFFAVAREAVALPVYFLGFK